VADEKIKAMKAHGAALVGSTLHVRSGAGLKLKIRALKRMDMDSRMLV